MNSQISIFKAIVVTFVLTALPAMTEASGEPVDEIKEASATGYVSVTVVRGRVRVIGWDKSSVRVAGTLDERTEEFIFDVDGDETTVEVKIKENRFGWGGSGDDTDLTIHVPASSRLEVGGVSTDVNILGLDKSIEAVVVSGDISLVGGPGRVEVQTVSGDLSIRDSSGRVSVSTVSGDIDSESVVGESHYYSVSGDIVVTDGGEAFKIETVSGEIDVVDGSVSQLSGHSVSGDIAIDTELLDAGVIEFANVSGSISVSLDGDSNARFDLETGSGTIRNKLTAARPVISDYLGDESLQFTLGNGEGQVSLSSRSGDVSVEQRR